MELSAIEQIVERSKAVEAHRLQLLTERNHYKRQCDLKERQYQSLRLHVILHQVVIALLIVAFCLVLGMVRYV